MRWHDNGSISIKINYKELIDRARRGLTAGEFRVVFQPIKHAQSGAVTSAECLLRWNHPEFGLLPASAFSEIFGDPAAALDVFRFVLAVSCEEFTSLKVVMPYRESRIAINIPASVLIRERLPDEIVETAACYGIDPSFLDLEIVETEDASKFLACHELTKSLRKLGVRLICDDFGISHPPLAMLGALHIDGLKLDKTFLKCIPDSNRATVVLQNMLALCGALRLNVVVEGVERAAQFKWLKSCGDVELQGMYIGEPQPDLTAAMLLD